MLQLIDLCFKYPSCDLQLNLHVKPGARLVLCGNSGIGKTTTLNLIAGLLPPCRGNILWHHQRLNNLTFKDRPIALLSQTNNIFDHLTVGENIELGRYSIPTLSRNEFWHDLYASIAALELMPYLDCKADTLSGGQRQRVALIRLISQRQKLWLMDEPFNGLDQNIKKITTRILLDWQARLQATIIFTTHHHPEIQQFATDSCYFREINALIQIQS